jgi:hypothetical protein
MDVRRYCIDNHVDSLSKTWLLSSVAEFAASGPRKGVDLMDDDKG